VTTSTTADPRETLTAIWAELLHLDPGEVPADTSFLRLGGDSVLAVRMSALVRKRLDVVLALSDVRVETTVDDLAELVGRRSADTGTPRAMPVDLRRRPDPNEPFPLMPLQQGYFVGQHDAWELSYESAHHYVDLGLVGLDGDDAAEALADALPRLAAHQPMLRARVTADGRQRILPVDDSAATPRLRVIDLREADPDRVAASLAELRAEMSSTGPDPRHGPGIDLRLTLLPEGAARLHSATSLLILDGWSSSVLYRDLFALVADWNAALLPLGIDFGDYVTAVAALPGTDAWRADRDWWWHRLDTLPQPPALPLRAEPAEVRPVLMGSREARVAPRRLAALRDRCAVHGVTPSTALFTAYAVVLARWAGHRRLLLNSLQLNRLPLHPDVHRVVGAFAATMLLPVELATGATFVGLARAVQRQFGELAGHNLISGVEVSRELGRRRNTHRPVAPVVFQSTLGMDAAFGDELPTTAGPLGEIVLSDYHQHLRTPQVALEVRLFELRDEMVIVFSLVEEIFHPEEVDSAFAELVGLAEELADGAAWDRVVELPERTEPPVDGVRLSSALGAGCRDHEPGAPRDDREERVTRLWHEMLGVPVRDRAANFFALGGDSLLAVRTLARIARDTGAALTVRDFLTAPTVAGMAELLRAAEGTPA
jgi:acyl carrier protein